ncbi:MAG: hypothetical protein ABIR30_01770 [Chitinophagaceae bacterium]
MRKKRLLFTAMIFFSAALLAQSVGVTGGGGTPVSNSSGPPIYLQELFRQPLQSQKHAGINGSPFVYDKWLLASLKLYDDRIADSVYIRINGYENKVHFKDENGEEMQVAVTIKEIIITDENPSWHGVVFRSGYNGGGNAFFQVLEDGKKMQLVKKLWVTKWETKALGEENKKSFQLEQEVYFAGNGELVKQNKKCSTLSEAFEKKQQEILNFAATNNIRCNKEEDMRKMVVYFNSL